MLVGRARDAGGACVPGAHAPIGPERASPRPGAAMPTTAGRVDRPRRSTCGTVWPRERRTTWSTGRSCRCSLRGLLLARGRPSLTGRGVGPERRARPVAHPAHRHRLRARSPCRPRPRGSCRRSRRSTVLGAAHRHRTGLGLVFVPLLLLAGLRRRPARGPDPGAVGGRRPRAWPGAWRVLEHHVAVSSWRSGSPIALVWTIVLVATGLHRRLGAPAHPGEPHLQRRRVRRGVPAAQRAAARWPATSASAWTRPRWPPASSTRSRDVVPAASRSLSVRTGEGAWLPGRASGRPGLLFGARRARTPGDAVDPCAPPTPTADSTTRSPSGWGRAWSPSSTCTPTTSAAEQSRGSSALVAEIGPKLAAALLFDEVRQLATVDERLRLAREIHDGIAQELASVGYMLDDLAARVPRGGRGASCARSGRTSGRWSASCG